MNVKVKFTKNNGLSYVDFLPKTEVARNEKLYGDIVVFYNSDDRIKSVYVPNFKGLGVCKTLKLCHFLTFVGF